ncbi:hypothetical protein [Photobacterium halotolerans]|uniref:hypothetical protein n=2 Tax=Photobacterium TaxID=657 RepID=UPI00041E108E|nr:hypothetical protein [Photobacterium halotolerans]
MARLHGSGGGSWKSGDIKIHNGPLESIPLGWVLCDGQNGTPDLCDRAIVGAGRAYSPNQTFGTDSRATGNHTLSSNQLPSSSMTYQRTSNFQISSISNAGVANRSVPNNGWSAYAETGRSSPRTLGLRLHNASTYVSTPGSGQSHNHGHVDVRQKSVAVIWIMKL